jgi:Protein adenylyltransferase SelO
MEPGAVVCRVSPSFIRFGTFQLPVSRGADQHYLCENLIEYLQKYHFQELVGTPDANLKMLEIIVDRTAELVAKWQLIGFVHGALSHDMLASPRSCTIFVRYQGTLPDIATDQLFIPLLKQFPSTCSPLHSVYTGLHLTSPSAKSQIACDCWID